MAVCVREAVPAAQRPSGGGKERTQAVDASSPAHGYPRTYIEEILLALELFREVVGAGA